MAAPQTKELPRAQTSTTSPVTEFSVDGMTCSNCVRHVTEAIQGVSGVHSATVSLDANRAKVRWAAGAEANVPAVIRAIEQEGYGAKAVEPHAHHHDPVER